MKIRNVLVRLGEILLASTIAGGIAIGANVPNMTGIFEPNQLASLFNTLVQSINFNTSGIVLVQTSTFGANVSTTNEQTLFVQTMPASALTISGQAFRIRCWGSSSSFGQNDGPVNTPFNPPRRLVGISLGPVGSSSIGGYFGTSSNPGGANPTMQTVNGGVANNNWTAYPASPAQIAYNQALQSTGSESWSMELLVTYNSSLLQNGTTTSGLTWLATGTHGASVSSTVASVDILDSLSLSGNLAPGAGAGSISNNNGPYQARCSTQLPNANIQGPNPQNADVLGLGFMVEQVK